MITGELKSKVDRVALPIPIPNQVEQNAFADRVDAAEGLKSTHRTSRAALDSLFASLQHRAFRGEL